MTLIDPEAAAEAVLSYYRSGALTALPPLATEPVWRKTPVRDIPREAAAATLPVEKMRTPSARPTSLRHPTLGGRLTVFVLCYGPHTDLARRCLSSVVDSMPPGSFDLRVACNACPPETLSYVRSMPVTRVYEFQENRLKYPVMREMFRDESCPIETNYITWFDDDSFVVNPLWVEKLCDAVVTNHPRGCRLYGAEFLHDFSRYRTAKHRPDEWFRGAPWYRGKDFLLGRQGRFSAPNGSTVKFVSGGFWALGVDALRAADIPDARLLHNGGDICIGEQVRQAGFRTFPFNKNKEFVHSSGAAPRGASRVGPAKRFPWQEGGETG